MVGCQVEKSVEVPEGMEMWSVVSHRYLVSGFCDQPKKMGKEWQAAVKRILPELGVIVRPDGPWLELYPENYHDSQSGKATCDLYTPIEG